MRKTIISLLIAGCSAFYANLGFAAKADIVFGIDFSGISMSGNFGKNYGDSLHFPRGAFATPKNGGALLSPINWALKMFIEFAGTIDHDGSCEIFGIGSKACHQNKQVFDLEKLANAADVDIEGLYQRVAAQLCHTSDVAGDFDPTPFMKHLMNRVAKSPTPELTLGVVFMSGSLEERVKTEISDILVRSSRLFPIKWLFVVVGAHPDSHAIKEVIKNAASGCVYENSLAIEMDSYFDFDGIFTSEFDIKDSLASTQNFKEKVTNFVEQEKDKVTDSIKNLTLMREVLQHSFLAP